MKILKNDALYFLYFAIIIIAFIYTTDIIVPGLKVVLNRILYIFIVAYFIVAKNFLFQTIKKSAKLFFILFLYSFFYLIKSLVHSGDVPFGFFISGGIMFPAMFLLLMVAGNIFDRRRIIAPFVLGSLFLLIVSLVIFAGVPVQYYSEDASLTDYYEVTKLSAGYIAFSGVYLNQNSLGTLAFAALMMLAFHASLGDRKPPLKKRVAFYTAVGIALLLLLLTVSRASILATVVFVFLLQLRNAKNKRIFFWYFFATVMLVFAVYFFPEYVEKLNDRIESDADSGRVDIWMDAIEQSRLNFFFGVGLYAITKGFSILNAHNIYLQILASHGIFVFFFWLLFLLIYIFRAAVIYFTRQASGERCKVIAAICLFTICIHQLFEVHIDGPFHPLTLWMFVVMSQMQLRYKTRVIFSRQRPLSY